MTVEQLIALCLLQSIFDDGTFFVPPDIHAHRCPEGHIWKHDGNMYAGSKMAHMCPQCGAGPIWERYDPPPRYGNEWTRY